MRTFFLNGKDSESRGLRNLRRDRTFAGVPFGVCEPAELAGCARGSLAFPGMNPSHARDISGMNQ